MSKTTTTTKTPATTGEAAPLGYDCNRNPYVARGSYRTADGKAQIDWELAQHREHGGALFSASGTYAGGGGQNLNEIAKAYPSDAKVQEIAAVWRVYHLNDVHAGCEHQRAEGWGEKTLTLIRYSAPVMKPGEFYPSQSELEHSIKGWVSYGMTVSPSAAIGDVLGKQYRKIYIGNHTSSIPSRLYSRVIDAIHREHVAAPLNPDDPRALWFAKRFDCKRVEETKRANWVKPSEHPEGVLGKVCPVCGYAFGSAWQFMPIPAEIVEQIKGWVAADNTAGESGYDATARAFLTDNGLALRITKSDSKPAPWDGGGHHYRVTLSRKGAAGRVAFDFWGSQKDAEEGEDPSAYSVLSCMASDVHTPATFAEFCSEFGEEEDSRKALQTFNRADRFAKRLRAFFTSKEIEALSEIR